MCKSISAAVLEFVMLSVCQPNPSNLFELPSETAKFYTPLDPYNEEQVMGAYGQDFAAKTGRKAKAKGPFKPKPWLQPKPPPSAQPSASQTDAAPSPSHNASVTGQEAAVPSYAFTLSDEQIDRIAQNRRKAQTIRHNKRLLWLQNFTEVSHICASPDHIDPVVRTVPNIRAGCTRRSRFCFGRTKPSDAIAAMASHMAHMVQGSRPRIESSVQGAGDIGVFEEVQ